MKLRRAHRMEEAVSPESPTLTDALAQGGVVEIRRITEIRVCSECLVTNSATDLYCTACGAELPRVRAAEMEPTLDAALIEQTRATEPETAEPSESRAIAAPVISPPIRLAKAEGAARGGRRLSVVLTCVLAAGGFIGTGAFAWLWHGQQSRAERFRTQRNQVTSQLVATEHRLKQTAESLKATTALSAQRRTVLLRAGSVLRKVDPLLSTVDGLQQKMGNVQTAGDTLSSAAETMVNDAVTLGNYLLQTDPAYIDATYEQQLIDTANADIASLRYDEGQMSDSNSTYSGASSHFSTVADGFSRAVRQLQKELQSVSK